ncbi:MAG: hypothetical protein WB609_02535 [Candidatus Cybelea sp.]
MDVRIGLRSLALAGFPAAALLLEGCSHQNSAFVPQAGMQVPMAGERLRLPQNTLLTDTAVAKHVLTGDYFGNLYVVKRLRGSTTVPPATAAKYLSWAEVLQYDQQKVDANGIKTLFYYNPTFQSKSGPLYNVETLAHTCSGRKIEAYRGSDNPIYLMNRETLLAQNAKTYIDQILAQNAFDMVYEDDSGLSPFQAYRHVGLPCHVTPKEWIARDGKLERTVGVKQLPSSLNAFTESASGWHNNPNSIQLAIQNQGGVMEQCYSSDSNPNVYFISGTLWAAEENTEIKVTAAQKLFFCYARNYSDADASVAMRLYDYASFLLTYRPAYAVLWETYYTASNFHVFPETGLVALDPAAHQPTDIAQLDHSGAYVRAYKKCYYRGHPVGACAAVVNPSDSASVTNPLYGKYKHSLALTGWGITDGGTATVDGAAAPKSIPKQTGYIVVGQ